MHDQSGPWSSTPNSSSIMTSVFLSLSSITPLDESTAQQDPARQRFLGPEIYQPPSALNRLSPSDAEHARNVFLTLQVLFPHELLPALDILDRGLVTRLTLRPESAEEVEHPLPKESPDVGGPWEVYYVQSSSAVTSSNSGRRGRGGSSISRSSYYSSRRRDATSTFYEVRLDSWNCSCPAFSVSAFQGLNVGGHDSDQFEEQPQADIDTTDQTHDWMFGGLATNPSSRSAPSCKHILAAVLAKAAPKLFSSAVTSREVSKEELAAWGAGWGEFGAR